MTQDNGYSEALEHIRRAADEIRDTVMQTEWTNTPALFNAVASLAQLVAELAAVSAPSPETTGSQKI